QDSRSATKAKETSQDSSKRVRSKRISRKRISWTLDWLRHGELARFGLWFFVKFQFAVSIGNSRLLGASGSKLIVNAIGLEIRRAAASRGLLYGPIPEGFSSKIMLFLRLVTAAYGEGPTLGLTGRDRVMDSRKLKNGFLSTSVPKKGVGYTTFCKSREGFCR